MTTEDQNTSLRIIYMGTPDFAVPALSALIESRHEVICVVTNPDRRSGRGKKLKPSPVKARALEAEVEVFQPLSFRKEPESVEHIHALSPDLIVVAAYGSILPQSLLDIPPMGCINIHASLLPEYRGAAPINWCIVRGESTTGITTMQMEAGLDTGPMLLKRSVEITPEDTAQTLHDKLSPLGADILLETIDGLIQGNITPETQDHDAASWAPMIKKTDGNIDWTKPAQDVVNLIRGFHPWPGAYTEQHIEGEDDPRRIKIHSAQATDANGEPGQVLSANSSRGELVIACGQGAISCQKVQAPGRKAMETRDFLNGYPLEAGQILGNS